MLGLVEGLTEFLPISSTGHLIIAGDVLGYTGEQAKTFSIVIQLGAILAVCWHYRERLLELLRSLLQSSESQRFVFNLFLAICPSALLGLALHGLIKHYLFTPTTVAVALIVGGFPALVRPLLAVCSLVCPGRQPQSFLSFLPFPPCFWPQATTCSVPGRPYPSMICPFSRLVLWLLLSARLWQSAACYGM